MKWSKLKEQVQERFAPAVAGRVTINQARYRHSGEELGRIWIAFDGEEVASFSTTTGHHARQQLAEELRELSGMRNPSLPHQSSGYHDADREARRLNRQAAVITDEEAQRQLEEYLNLAIEAALASDSPLIRALAFLDARAGKRRLTVLGRDTPIHPLVRRAWQFRCAAERLPTEPDAAV